MIKNTNQEKLLALQKERVSLGKDLEILVSAEDVISRRGVDYKPSLDPLKEILQGDIEVVDNDISKITSEIKDAHVAYSTFFHSMKVRTQKPIYELNANLWIGFYESPNWGTNFGLEHLYLFMAKEIKIEEKGTLVTFKPNQYTNSCIVFSHDTYQEPHAHSEQGERYGKILASRNASFTNWIDKEGFRFYIPCIKKDGKFLIDYSNFDKTYVRQDKPPRFIALIEADMQLADSLLKRIEDTSK